MGMPQEWNLFTLINAAFLFGLHGGVTFKDLAAVPTPLLAFLFTVEFLVPLLGNFYSKYVSFLPAMRYYAGNWPISVVLIKRSAYQKLGRRL